MATDPVKHTSPDELRQRVMRKPPGIDPLAEKVLELLTGTPEASEIVLGGYFALQHYAPYRHTHDLDAWWKTRAHPAAEQVIRTTMQQVAVDQGLELRERRFGETVSFELLRGGQRLFSFQIAVRSIALEEPWASAWPPLRIETLFDNVGSKMNALVDRGAPRDFLDIQHVTDLGLVTIPLCWELWSKKNPDEVVEAAQRKVLFHLTSLENRRPLEAIPDASERERARRTREWFKQEFLKP